MNESKSQPISKRMVWEAFKSVKANQGGAGIDGITLQKFEENLSDNLYKLWNRMASGSYFPSRVKEVLIPKRTGGFRKLCIPTVSDRITQAVVKMYLEPRLEQVFHPNSFGYRPGRSAALDVWLDRNLKGLPFQRYADDLVLHCQSYEEAKEALVLIRQRLAACGLSLNEKKTQIAYCADSKRRRNYPNRKFTFLGYTFQPRTANGRRGKFVSFGPAMSKAARKEFSLRVRRQKITRRTSQSITELARDLNKIIRGYFNYFGLYNRQNMYGVFRNLNIRLLLWVRRKYKRFESSKRRAKRWLQMNYRRNPKLFAHWEFMKP